MYTKHQYDGLTKALYFILAIAVPISILWTINVFPDLSSYLNLNSVQKVITIIINFCTFAAAFVAYLLSGLMPRKRIYKIILCSLILTIALMWWAAQNKIINIDLFMKFVIFMSITGIITFVDAACQIIIDKSRMEKIIPFLIYGITIQVFSMVALKILYVVNLLNPHVLDLNAYMFDQAIGIHPSLILTSIHQLTLNNYAVLGKFFNYVYQFIFIPPLLIVALSIKYEEKVKSDFVPAFVLTLLFVGICFNLAPVSGPRFFFGDNYIFHMQQLKDAPNPSGYLLPTMDYRNGFPSMHFGWALLYWLYSIQMNIRWFRAFCAILLGLTFLAIFVTGQHYLVDLVPSFPTIVAIYAVALRIGDKAYRKKVFWFNLALLAFWIFFLRFGAGIALNYPFLIAPLEIATVVVSAISYQRMVKSSESEKVIGTPRETTYVELVRGTITTIRERILSNRFVVVLVFFFSGLAGLIYEVVFSKLLAEIFGSTGLANFTVLASYMSGMAIGAWVGGIAARKVRSRLLAYATCEGFIGIYFLLTPLLIIVIKTVYISLASGMEIGSVSLTLLRVLLGFSVLFIPTVLMGATLPLLVKYLSDDNHSIGISVSSLYGANTLGAALGALSAGYAFIPLLGIHKTAILAAAINLLVALAILRLHKHRGQKLDTVQERVEEPVGDYRNRPLAGSVALFMLLVGGAITMSLEINYTHLLAVVAGNSVYAFSLMLATFLLGLALGAMFAKRFLQSRLDTMAAALFLQCGFAAVTLLQVFVWSAISQGFLQYTDFPMHLFDPTNLSMNFSQREFVRGVMCLIAMLPPACFIGCIFPILLEVIGKSFRNSIAMTSLGISLNTVGNILGVILGAFYLLPRLGSLSTIHLLALAALLLAVLAVPMQQTRRMKMVALLPIAVVVALFLVQPKSFDYTKLASGANVYFRDQRFGEVVDHAESIDGGLTAVHKKTRGDQLIFTLTTNAKFQGISFLGGEMIPQVGVAVAPMMYTQARDHALVIGYGTGVTARALHDAGFRDLDVVELSRDIIGLANKYFTSVNSRVTEKPGVHTFIADGKNFLLLRSDQYDLITIEISSIWFAGASALYNREFYQIAKARLKPQGVLQQWVQLHHMRGEDFLTIMATVRSEFKYVCLRILGGQGILIASDTEITPKQIEENLQALQKIPAVEPLLDVLGGARKIEQSLLLSPALADHYLASASNIEVSKLASTDDNRWLEYGTPKGNAIAWKSATALATQLVKLSGAPVAIHEVSPEELNVEH